MSAPRTLAVALIATAATPHASDYRSGYGAPSSGPGSPQWPPPGGVSQGYYQQPRGTAPVYQRGYPRPPVGYDSGGYPVTPPTTYDRYSQPAYGRYQGYYGQYPTHTQPLYGHPGYGGHQPPYPAYQSPPAPPQLQVAPDPAYPDYPPLTNEPAEQQAVQPAPEYPAGYDHPNAQGVPPVTPEPLVPQPEAEAGQAPASGGFQPAPTRHWPSYQDPGTFVPVEPRAQPQPSVPVTSTPQPGSGQGSDGWRPAVEMRAISSMPETTAPTAEPEPQAQSSGQ